MANASTEFLPAANEFNTSLGEVVGSFATSLVEADALAQQSRLRVIEALVKDAEGNPRPPLDFVAEIKGSDGNTLLRTDVSAPLIALADSSGFMTDTAKLTMDMEVASHAEDYSSLQAEASGEGQVGVGFGPFKGSVKIQAKTSVSKESKRSSDYTSRTHAELTMCRVPPPEGLAIIVDGINKTVQAGIDLQLAVTNDQIQKAAGDLKVLPDSGERAA